MARAAAVEKRERAASGDDALLRDAPQCATGALDAAVGAAAPMSGAAAACEAAAPPMSRRAKSGAMRTHPKISSSPTRPSTTGMQGAMVTARRMAAPLTATMARASRWVHGGTPAHQRRRRGCVAPRVPGGERTAAAGCRPARRHRRQCRKAECLRTSPASDGDYAQRFKERVRPDRRRGESLCSAGDVLSLDGARERCGTIAGLTGTAARWLTRRVEATHPELPAGRGGCRRPRLRLARCDRGPPQRRFESHPRVVLHRSGDAKGRRRARRALGLSHL